MVMYVRACKSLISYDIRVNFKLRYLGLLRVILFPCFSCALLKQIPIICGWVMKMPGSVPQRERQQWKEYREVNKR